MHSEKTEGGARATERRRRDQAIKYAALDTLVLDLNDLPAETPQTLYPKPYSAILSSSPQATI